MRSQRAMVETVPYFVAPDDPELLCEDKQYPGKTCPVKAYLARPKRDERHPGVLVIHALGGINEHFKDIARRLAKEGWVGLVPDLLSRAGGRERFENRNEAMRVVRALSPDQVSEDLLSGMEYLKTLSYVDPRKIGVIGFCWGGSQSLYLQTKAKGLSAGVVFYGHNPDDLESVKNLDWPFLGIYADEQLDPKITGKVPELERAFKRHGKRYSIHIYPGAAHAFHTNDNPEWYHPEAARDAWTKTVDFFKENMG